MGIFEENQIPTKELVTIMGENDIVFVGKRFVNSGEVKAILNSQRNMCKRIALGLLLCKLNKINGKIIEIFVASVASFGTNHHWKTLPFLLNLQELINSDTMYVINELVRDMAMAIHLSAILWSSLFEILWNGRREDKHLIIVDAQFAEMFGIKYAIFFGLDNFGSSFDVALDSAGSIAVVAHHHMIVNLKPRNKLLHSIILHTTGILCNISLS